MCPCLNCWESILYWVTDSVNFIHNADEPPKVRTGDYRCYLTDEFEEFCSGSYIEEVALVGNKNYAFIVFCRSTGKPTNKCQVRGIKLNYENSKAVNFTTLTYMILKDTTPVHVYNPKKIKQHHGTVFVSEPEMKEYKFFFKKHRLIDNLTPHPTGMINLFLVPIMCNLFIYLFISLFAYLFIEAEAKCNI